MTALSGIEEVRRLVKVSDMLCSGHAALRDRYSRWSLFLDLGLLVSSTWLVALTFAEESVIKRLSPFEYDPKILIGLMGLAVFFLSLVQFKTDWKGRSDSHKRSLEIFAEVKREGRYLLSRESINEAECQRVLARYDMACAVAVEIPEDEFLIQKRRHRGKVALSKYLDKYPFASIVFLRIRFWMRDNALASRCDEA